MNKNDGGKKWNFTLKKYFRGKWKDWLLIIVLVFVLLFAVSRIFKKEENLESVQMTETERKVERFLQEMEGVGDAEVIVCEGENGEENVVIVCEGANNFQVVLNVREAVAAALGVDAKSVKIYQKVKK